MLGAGFSRRWQDFLNCYQSAEGLTDPSA